MNLAFSMKTRIVSNVMSEKSHQTKIKKVFLASSIFKHVQGQGQGCALYELQSKLLKGGYIGDYIGD